MPDKDQVPETRTNGATWADVAIHIIDAIRDILNDRWVILGIIALALLWAGKLTSGDLGPMVEGWIRALKGVP
jgi:hypothetical protein